MSAHEDKTTCACGNPKSPVLDFCNDCWKAFDDDVELGDRKRSLLYTTNKQVRARAREALKKFASTRSTHPVSQR